MNRDFKFRPVRTACSIAMPLVMVLSGHFHPASGTQQSERAESIKFARRRICDKKKEVSLIRSIEVALNTVVVSEGMPSKKAVDLMRNPLKRFEVFQGGNGGLYIEYEFHWARRLVGGVDGEHRDLAKRGNGKVLEGTRNVLKSYRDELGKVRGRLMSQIKTHESDLLFDYETKASPCYSNQKAKAAPRRKLSPSRLKRRAAKATA